MGEKFEPHEAFYWELHEGMPNQAVRFGDIASEVVAALVWDPSPESRAGVYVARRWQEFALGGGSMQTWLVDLHLGIGQPAARPHGTLSGAVRRIITSYPAESLHWMSYTEDIARPLIETLSPTAQASRRQGGASSAMRTISIARTTPAQKPRGFNNKRVFPSSRTVLSCSLGYTFPVGGSY